MSELSAGEGRGFTREELLDHAAKMVHRTEGSIGINAWWQGYRAGAIQAFNVAVSQEDVDRLRQASALFRTMNRGEDALYADALDRAADALERGSND